MTEIAYLFYSQLEQRKRLEEGGNREVVEEMTQVRPDSSS